MENSGFRDCKLLPENSIDYLDFLFHFIVQKATKLPISLRKQNPNIIYQHNFHRKVYLPGGLCLIKVQISLRRNKTGGIKLQFIKTEPGVSSSRQNQLDEYPRTRKIFVT